MKKVIMGMLVVGVLLVSLASAGLVDFLSNVVTGTIEVEGPVFYLDGALRLSVNEYSSNAYPPYKIVGRGEKEFKTNESYNGMDFYKPTVRFVVDVDVNNLTDPRGLEFDFGYIKTNGNSVTICSVQYISIIENGIIEIDCPLPEVDDDEFERTYFRKDAPEDINEFYFSIDGMANDDIEYTIKKHTSYIKITGVADE